MYGEPTFGAWLKSRRRQLDLTQKGLAHQVGCSVGTIRKMEADERQPSRQLAGLLAECLEIPPDQHEIFIAFARSEAYISDTPLPVLSTAEDQIPIISQETKEPKIKIKHNLPLAATPFVGRDAELAALDALLKDQGRRLITILGPGGIGKTRLGIACAERQLEHKDGLESHPYKDGVFFVDLAPLEQAERLVFSLADVLDLRDQARSREKRSTKQLLLDYLRNKRMLFVLDNFEHLLSPLPSAEDDLETDSAGLVGAILGIAPQVSILVTSRERLNLQMEQVFSIDGLIFPDRGLTAPVSNLEDVVGYTAIQFFLQAAQRNQQDFNLESDDERLGLVQICQMVDGMPLALELAASWVDTLSVQDIAAEIQHGLDLLESDMRDVPMRQRSMQASFDASWWKLDERERSIFTQLSVYRGGFTRAAAQVVTGASLLQLNRLVNKSFIQFNKQHNRYQIHELLRQYGAERLGRDRELERVVQDRHSSYFCQALTVWERELQGPRQVAAVQEMLLEIDNIRSAWKWAADNHRFEVLMGGINGLCIFLERKCLRQDGETICRSLVERLDYSNTYNDSRPGTEDPLRTEKIGGLKLKSRALAWEGYFNLRLGYLDRSDELIHKCFATLGCDELTGQDTRFEKALAFLCLTCVMDLKKVPHDQTKHFVEEAVEMFRSLEEPWWVGFALYTSGVIGVFSNVEENEEYFEKSLVAQRQLGDMRGMADSLEYWSYFFAGRLQFEKAEAMLNEALAISKEIDDRHKVVSLCGTLGWQWVWQGRFEEARALYAQTLATYSDLDYSQSEAILLHAHLGYPDLYLGKYEAARNKAQHAIELLSKSNHFYTALWTAYCKDIFGKAALAEGSFAEAEQYFTDCQLVFRNYQHKEKLSTNLACLGYIARAQNQLYKAQGCLFQALGMGYRIIMCLPHILPGIALLFADLGDSERAVEIHSFATTMGWVTNSKWFDDIAGVQIRAAASQLGPEVTKSAQERGSSLDLWEGAEQLLLELEASGWGSAGQ